MIAFKVKGKKFVVKVRMQNQKTAGGVFFGNNGLDMARVSSIADKTLGRLDDGEIFLEVNHSESLLFDDGRLKNASCDLSQGFGMRGVMGEAMVFAQSSVLTEEAMKRAAEVVGSVNFGSTADAKLPPPPELRREKLYGEENPLDEVPFAAKSLLLAEIDSYLRAKDDRVKQVSVSLSGEWQAVFVVRPGNAGVGDIRPLVRLNITVMVEKNGRMERGSAGVGGREGYAAFTAPEAWKAQADEALRQALVNLESRPAPAGEMPVVLGPGWPAVLLHEAVGHGLEGDFNRKKTSVFSGLMGDMVAAKGVTVVDDGTIGKRRGSLNIDDEGTPTGKNVLIENGRLVGLMQDRMNARLMGAKPTGNGRRESFEHKPLPRMTNTIMLSGDKTREEIISSVKSGIYAVNFAGGQVDIVSGKFVFTASEAYRIEGGKVGAPVKGVTLIGSGPETMKKISMVGDDMSLDPGIGTCGKDGQGVPVGVGQPTLLVSSMTVGGTETG